MTSPSDANVDLQIDGNIALVNSSNIQNTVNVEMMAHVEVSVLHHAVIHAVCLCDQGSIVEAFYDVCLLSWANTMKPPLPLLSAICTPPTHYKSEGDHSHIALQDLQL